MIIRWSHSIGICIHAITVSPDDDWKENRRHHLHKKQSLNAEQHLYALSQCSTTIFFSLSSHSLSNFFIYFIHVIPVLRSYLAMWQSKQAIFFLEHRWLNVVVKTVITFFFVSPRIRRTVYSSYELYISFTIRINQWKSHIIAYSKCNYLFWS